MTTKHKQYRPVRWLSFLTVITILAACQNATPTVTPTIPSVDPNAVRTAAAQTADARLNALPSPTPNPPTPDAAQWTQTALAQASPTLNPTQTLDPSRPTAVTITPTIASSAVPTLQPAGADNATYVKDVTIPDNTVIDPGAKFTKTWQFRNSGSSNWTTQYELVWVSGDQMGNTASVNVPMDVPAGQTVDISVELTAPTADGTYKGFWRMRNPSSQYFGDAVYVLIQVGSGGATARPTASGSVTPTTTPPTPTTASGAVGAVTVSVNNTSVTAACPYKFVISANVELKAATTISYQLEAGGYALTLPAPRTESLGAGNYTFTYELEISQSGTGWARLHVTSPVDVTSNEVSFSLTCSP
ncbi:MAG: NBR1-Ig-like domain-containing protein [Chloroflexota bacterium]